MPGKRNTPTASNPTSEQQSVPKFKGKGEKAITREPEISKTLFTGIKYKTDEFFIEVPPPPSKHYQENYDIDAELRRQHALPSRKLRRSSWGDLDDSSLYADMTNRLLALPDIDTAKFLKSIEDFSAMRMELTKIIREKDQNSSPSVLSHAVVILVHRLACSEEAITGLCDVLAKQEARILVLETQGKPENVLAHVRAQMRDAMYDEEGRLTGYARSKMLLERYAPEVHNNNYRMGEDEQDEYEKAQADSNTEAVDAIRVDAAGGSGGHAAGNVNEVVSNF
jgi:hypothetical protein